MPLNKSIALVGRPNVGKSRLFNRMLGRRVSIVHDMPGVTRDIVAEKLPCGAVLMDTGGIGATAEMTHKVIADATDEQAEFAISAADLIILVVDSQSGLVPLDEKIAEKIRKSGRDAILAVNKADIPEHDSRIADFCRLGFAKVCPVSAEHGRGMGELWEAVQFYLGDMKAEPAPEASAEDYRVKICVAGRPNVGKSSIGNRLLGSKRLIVSDVAGTTRDPVKCDIDFANDRGDVLKFEFFDTAGVRAKRKVNTSLDFFSTMRTKEAISKCDVVMLVIDAMEGVAESDQKLAGEILAGGAAVMFVVNKWDYAVEAFKKDGVRGYDSISKFREKFEEAVREKLFFLAGSPIHFVSAKENKGMEGLLIGAAKLYRKSQKPLPTSKINSLLADLVKENPPKYVNGRRFKIYYAVQTSSRPITLRLYCNNADILTDAYKRFLENSIRESFKLGGLSMKLELVGKTKIAADERLAQKNLKTGKAKAEKPRRQKKSPAKGGIDPRKKHSLKKLIARKEAVRQKIRAMRKK
ncbi:MAG: ribosome biogenesis GTPase Der [Opitutales bacterium]|nr:ribosome biogenesis GTPase Der [Opitutales bacterium]